jgi:hypothetical protein
MGKVNWTKLALVALAPAGLALGYAFWRYGATLLASPRFWALLLPTIVTEVGGALAGEYLEQTGRVVIGKLVGLAAIAWLIGGCVLFEAKTSAATLTSIERAPFVTVDDGDRPRLRHPALGFSILHPGPAFIAERTQTFRPDTQFYSFVDPGEAVRLVIGLFKGQGESSSSLRQLLQGLSSQANALGGEAKVPARVVELETSEAEPPRGSLRLVLGDGRLFRTTAYGWRAADGTPFVILLGVIAHTPDAGADVLASFRP